MNRLIVVLVLMLSTMQILTAQDGVQITNLDESDGFAESRVTCVIQDKQGLIWIATWDGLYRYNGYKLRNYKARPGDNCPLEINRIDYIQEQKNGDILCKVTNKYYLFNKQTHKFTAFKGKRTEPDILYSPSAKTTKLVRSIERYANIPIKILRIDKQGGIWVHSHLGLNRITFAKKPINNHKIGTEGEEFVRGLMEDSNGRLWVADKNGYLRVMNRDNSLKGYLTPNGKISSIRTKFGYSVYCMYEDRKKTIWIGTKKDGLFRLKPTADGYKLNHYTKDKTNHYSINHNDIYAIAEDGYGQLWVATYGGGLNMVTDNGADNLKFINSNNKLKKLHAGDVEIHCMKIIRGNILLVGTNEGLYSAKIERNPAQIKFYNNRRDPADATSLSNNRVMDIINTRSGTVYVATYGGGLCRLLSNNLLTDTLRFKAYTTENGLASDVTESAIEDRHGYIWIISEASISCLNPKTETFTNYKKSIFSCRLMLTEVHPLCTADGRLVIGTSQGTLEFKPSELHKSNYVPPIVTSCSDSINLKPDDRNVTIEIAALDYNKNEAIEYAYMMEGIDTNWNYTTDNRITYANIPAGTYKLRIKSTNGDGMWTNNERTIVIHRTPRFNETPLAWMIYGGLLLLALYIAIQVMFYIKHLRRELSNTKLTTNEKIQYMLLKSGEKKDEEPAKLHRESKKDDEDWKERVKQFMNDNLGNADMTVNDFASAMSMSRSVLYLNIKRVFGVTPNNFIQDARINRAKQLIKERNANISEIAYQCGFADPKYFSRCFKKATGMKPTEYQKEDIL